MKRIIPFVLVLLVGCKEELPKVPVEIISMDSMTLIMADIHIADALAETKAQGGENEKELSQKYYEKIFSSHHISKEDYTKSFQYYEHNPVLLNKMYDDVLNTLSKREEEIGKK
jgi:hypothetical protein